MSEYTSIKISKKLNERMQLIKKQNNYKSINELLENTLDKTVREELEVIREQALFYVGDIPVTWCDLKNSSNGTVWSQGEDEVTVLFKDDQGAFLRFTSGYDVGFEYFHFLG